MLTYLPAAEADIATLRTLAGEIWRACYPGIISPSQIEYMLERMYAPEVIRREMTEGVMWELLRWGDKPIGFVSCALDHADGCLQVHKLYLLPAFHGRGLGRQALESLQAKAVRLGLGTIRLSVNKRNERAITAYQRAGFRIASSVTNDIGEGHVMEDYVMRWQAPPR